MVSVVMLYLSATSSIPVPCINTYRVSYQLGFDCSLLQELRSGSRVDFDCLDLHVRIGNYLWTSQCDQKEDKAAHRIEINRTAEFAVALLKEFTQSHLSTLIEWELRLGPVKL